MAMTVQEQFDEASQLRVSPCAWIPPKWADLVTRDNQREFKDTPEDLSWFRENENLATKRLKDWRDMDKNPIDSPEQVPGDNAWTSPFADFTHIDENECADRDIVLAKEAMEPIDNPQDYRLGVTLLEQKRDAIMQNLRKSPEDTLARQRFDAILRVLGGKGAGNGPTIDKIVQDFRNGAIAAAITQVLTQEHEMKAFDRLRNTLETNSDVVSNVSKQNALFRLRQIAGDNAAGMRRLERVFEWALYRTTELLGELNIALKHANAEEEYSKARDNYIAFLRDLDDHEPGRSGEKLDPRGEDPGNPNGPKKKLRRSGYGITIKWNCIRPVIENGKIVGARVIIQWNPHSTSSGIPVQHP